MNDLAALDALAVEALLHFEMATCGPPILFNLSENATYKVDSITGESWALRLHRPGYQTEDSIASELAWTFALREAGVATTPIAVRGRNGAFIQRTLKRSSQDERFAVLTKWEKGVTPEFTDLLESSFVTLGALTAHMHGHARSWRRPTWFTRQNWDFESSLGDEKPLWGRWRNAIGMTREHENLFDLTVERIGSRLQRYGKSAQRFGLVHGDLRLANLLIDDSCIKILDFDDCGFGWFMYDAATTISFYEHVPQAPALLEAWKAGYRTVAPLAAEDEAEIQTFVMLRRLLLMAWISSHSETDLAKSTGLKFTADSCGLCENYLTRFE